jgi:hypothetical protein
VLVPWPGLGPMALAASCLARRWIAWTREIITFAAPAHAVGRAYHPTHESNAGRSGGVPGVDPVINYRLAHVGPHYHTCCVDAIEGHSGYSDMGICHSRACGLRSLVQPWRVSWGEHDAG